MKRSSEVVETISRRNVDICSVQEHRWKGSLSANQARTLKGRDTVYKFFWSGNSSGIGGVGLLLAEKWIENVFDMQRISERFFLLRIVVGKSVLTFVSVWLEDQNLKKIISMKTFKI